MDKLQLVKLAAKETKDHFLEGLSRKTGCCFNKPLNISIEISGKKCILRCKQCFMWNQQDVESLTSDEFKKIIIDLKKWLGGFRLDIGSRGEPFSDKDKILDIISFCTSVGGIRTHVNTNAYLIDEELAKQISNSGLSSISISWDGFKPETHDFLRGVKGTYARVIDAINFLKENAKETKISISTTIMQQNLDELADLVRFTKEKELFGIGFQALQSRFGVPYDVSWFDYKKNNLWPENPENVCRKMDELLKMKQKGFPVKNDEDDFNLLKRHYMGQTPKRIEKCAVGYSNFLIDCQGNVKLCYSLPPIGNIKEQKLKNIWNKKEAKNRRKQIIKCKLPCNIHGCNRKVSVKGKAIRFIKEFL